ncbi:MULTISPECIES: hypothetical protein [Tenacibaculum]|uniref:hypothetical protein n=1 Tax=Tenacibaculum TaxID=104267 RepID=UPI00187B6A10|nr:MULTISPECIES: hypothetical protein [Tenacibaculum]MBE7648309.1 hypothetical protein [Tenacibaculum finnmarkense genomovar ulcerans]MBE7690691.1 hypothetical protein [Tenacibaculum piscium]
MILNKGFKYQIMIESAEHNNNIICELQKIGFNWFFENHIPPEWDCILVSQKKTFMKEKKNFTRGESKVGVETLTIEQLKEKFD